MLLLELTSVCLLSACELQVGSRNVTYSSTIKTNLQLVFFTQIDKFVSH